MVRGGDRIGGRGGGEEDRRRGDDEGGERALDGRPTRGDDGESVDGDQEEGDGDGDAVGHHHIFVRASHTQPGKEGIVIGTIHTPIVPSIN